MNHTKWCKTAYLTEYSISPATTTCLIVLNVIVAFLNILTNGLLIYALRKTKQLEKISNQFIVCLSVSDCGVGLLAQPFVIAAISNSRTNNVVSCTIEIASQAVGFVFCHFSGVMLAIIAVDRYFHIKYKTKYSSHMSQSRGRIIVIANLFVAIAVAGGSILSSIKHTYVTFDLIMMSIDTIVVLFIWLNYVLIFRSIRGHMKTILRKDSRGNQCMTSIVRADAVLAKTMIIIMTSQAICYFPYFLSSSLRPTKVEAHKESWLGSFRWWSLLLVYLCGSVNALIFIFRNAKIRRHFFKTSHNNPELSHLH